jgi:hypothetical protein
MGGAYIHGASDRRWRFQAGDAFAVVVSSQSELFAFVSSFAFDFKYRFFAMITESAALMMDCISPVKGDDGGGEPLAEATEVVAAAAMVEL